MNASAVKQTLKKISLSLVSACIAVLVVELSLRLFAPRYYPVIPASFEYDGELGYRLRPDGHLFESTDFQQESIANKLGTANFQETFDAYQSLVFTIGDSYTQGTGLPADMSYPAQLDLMLNRDERGLYVKKYGVVNLGVAGFGGEQEWLSLRRWEQLLRPPSVILYLGCDNDFIDDLAFKSGARHEAVLRGSPVWGRLTTPLRLLLERSQIGLRLRAAWQERSRRKLSEAALGPAGNSAPVAELQSPVLERFATYAQEHDAVLVVSWSEDGASYRWLRTWADAHRIAFADWAAQADSVRAAMPQLPLDNQHAGGHHRGWTNRIIAEEFMRRMRERGR